MRRAAAVVLSLLPAIGAGCADLIGITELPGPVATDAGGDGGHRDHFVPKDAADSGAGDARHDGDAADAPTDQDAADDASIVTFTLKPAEGLHLIAGTSRTVEVDVARGSFKGPIPVTVLGLPTGVTATGTTIPASSSKGTVKLTAAGSAPFGGANVTVLAESMSVPYPIFVAGPSASFDTSFGSGGAMTTGSAGDTAWSVVMDSDGSLYVGGQQTGFSGNAWVVLHVLANGTVDGSFTPTLPSTGVVNNVALGPGKGPLAHTILVSGWSSCTGYLNAATLYILDKTGSPFTTFAGTGSLCNGSSGSAAVGAAASTAGDVYIGVNATPSSPYVLHYTSTGSYPYTSWSATGLGGARSLVGVTLDASENLILTAGQFGQFLAARIPAGSTTGMSDPTYGGVFGAASANLNPHASALDPDGGVYIGGAGTSSGQTPVLGHVNAAGMVDVGDGGWVPVNIAVSNQTGFDGLAVQSDGRVVGIGDGYNGSSVFQFVARTTTAGALDTTFNPDGGPKAGYLEEPGGSITYNAVAVAPAPDGRIVVVGADSSAGLYVARIWP